MTEAELFNVIEGVNAQYATLFGMIISANFAAIVATWYFLHRARLGFRLAAFGFYLIGMLMLVGMLIEQTNFKNQAITALQAIPPATRSPFIDGVLAVQASWVFRAVAVFQNLSLWALIGVVAFLLFGWKGRGEGD